MVSLCSGRIRAKTLCWKTLIRLIKRLTETTTTSGFGDQFTEISMSFSFLTLGNLDAESLAIGTVGHTSHIPSDSCHWVFEWCFPSLEGVVIVCVNSICSPDTYWNAHLLCRGNTMPQGPSSTTLSNLVLCAHCSLPCLNWGSSFLLSNQHLGNQDWVFSSPSQQPAKNGTVEFLSVSPSMAHVIGGMGFL